MHINWWTLALQTVNVLILIWILSRFFFRPVIDIVAKRQQQADKLLADAARVRLEAADERVAADKTNAEIAAERERLLAQAHSAAQSEKQNLLAQSSAEIARRRAEAEAAIVRDRLAAEAAIVDHASNLAVEIARRLLARLPRQNTLDAFVEETCRELRALPPEAREGLASAATAHPLEVVTAAPLADDDSQHVRAALTRALGRELPVTFASDPAIIAGIELVGQNAIIRNSWRADLDRIRREISRDENGRKP